MEETLLPVPCYKEEGVIGAEEAEVKGQLSGCFCLIAASFSRKPLTSPFTTRRLFHR